MSKNEYYMALKGLLHWHLLFNFRHTSYTFPYLFSYYLVVIVNFS